MLLNTIKNQAYQSFLSLSLSDRQFAELWFLKSHRHRLHLNPPRTFSEKIQWLNLYGGLERYAPLVDKYSVREFVAAKIGEQYLDELYGVYDHESDIDFDALPEKFVLKATHGCGMNIFCRDKSRLDIAAAKKKLGTWLNTNYYHNNRERLYKNIRPRIICEQLLEDPEHKDIPDYKLLCFHGKVEYIQVHFDRYTNHSMNSYDKNWNSCPFEFHFPTYPGMEERPKNLEEMKAIAETLAEGIPLVRVDLYNTQNRLYFGELTFLPGAGYEPIFPYEWDYKLGDLLRLPV